MTDNMDVLFNASETYTKIKAKSSSKHGHLPKVAPTPELVYIQTLEKNTLVFIERESEQVNSPSISTFRPIVSFHRFPALAILRNRLSASTVFRLSAGTATSVELAASNVD